ncbi:hypothetical protein MesoLjLa_12610 [Mesorhizobium sp. L-2-11]|nr:hypothetical protein MesoLjLa_12610 [Mesorhizobium sp. L-2-11]
MLSGGAGYDALDSGSGLDTVDYRSEGGPNGVRVNLLGDAPQEGLPPDTAIDTYGNSDRAIGTWFDDTILGGINTNHFRGMERSAGLHAFGWLFVVPGPERIRLNRATQKDRRSSICFQPSCKWAMPNDSAAQSSFRWTTSLSAQNTGVTSNDRDTHRVFVPRS